jgi:hypothetical protein
MTLFVCLGAGGSLYGDEQCSGPGAAHALTRACVRVAGVPAYCTRNRSPLMTQGDGLQANTLRHAKSPRALLRGGRWSGELVRSC